MKDFETTTFDLEQCRSQVAELRALLENNAELGESDHILPFFRTRRAMCLLFACYDARVTAPDRFAYEFDLFGDFACDLAVGDAANHRYTLVEFEDAKPESLFRKVGKKSTPEWAPRFDHGHSQVVDWLFKISSMRRTDDFRYKFGSSQAHFTVLVVVGRDEALGQRERDRLEWRERSVLVDSTKVYTLTFDGLLADFESRLARSTRLVG